jgi:cob(I)alamin adenosyltransferase
MKIYTKTGDDGTTGLLGAARVSKSDARIDCYGNIDELNAAIGWAAIAGDAPLAQLLRAVQSQLFAIGSLLAVPDGAAPPASLPVVDEGWITQLESQIDAATVALPPLRNFVLPGGTEAAARLHVARTICRRAERRLVEFAASHEVPKVILVYLNRLSDWLFVQARAANQRAGVTDVLWREK